MLILLKGGRIVDPVNGRDEIGDLWIENDRIVTPPPGGWPMKSTTSPQDRHGGRHRYSFHIAGGNENIARLLLPNCTGRGAAPVFPALATAKWSTFETGCRYAAMGFTTVIEPRSPHQALQAHLELSDIPIIDKGTLTVLGNDDFLLSLIHGGEGRRPWLIMSVRSRGEQWARRQMHQRGGATAFKYNVRSLVSMTSCLSTNSPHAKSSRLCRGR